MRRSYFLLEDVFEFRWQSLWPTAYPSDVVEEETNSQVARTSPAAALPVASDKVSVPLSKHAVAALVTENLSEKLHKIARKK